MKIKMLLSCCMFILCAFAAERQLPVNQKWDGKKFYKATKQSLPLAKKLLDEFEWRHFGHILDIGCGSGSLTAHIARRAPHAQVVGIDPSGSMIKFAQGYYQLPENLTFEQATVPNYGSWDFIFSCNAFHLLPRDKQIAALQQFALCAIPSKDVALFIIMAAKTKQPQTFTRAYAATLAMPRWEKLRAFNLDDYFQPHDADSFKELSKDSGFVIREIECQDEYIKFQNAKKLKEFIASWMGGFEFVAQLPQEEQKKLIKALVANYLEEEPLALDGSVEWRSQRLIVHAEKPKAR